MLKRSCIPAAGGIVAVLVLASSASATTPPMGNGLITNVPVMCRTQPGPYNISGMLTRARGASFYITTDNGSNGYELLSLAVTTGGNTVVKSYGNRTGQTLAIECEGSVGTTAFVGLGVSVAP